jgi:inner membrane protein
MDPWWQMAWWHWAVIGLVLVGLEMAGPGGFYIIFFGMGALVVALLSLLGLDGPLWLQWLFFSVFSIGSLLAFRNPLLRRLRTDQPAPLVDSLVGELAIPVDDIAPGAVGRAELRGAVWSARNVDLVPLVKGQRCAVQRIEGLLISIRAEGAS